MVETFHGSPAGTQRLSFRSRSRGVDTKELVDLLLSEAHACRSVIHGRLGGWGWLQAEATLVTGQHDDTQDES